MIASSVKSRALSGLLATALTLASFVAADSALAEKNNGLPPVSPEGLRLAESDQATVVYLREGVDFTGYDSVMLMDCYVAFRKNWERDQRSTTGFRVRDEDILEIKEQLAGEFGRVFTEELMKKGTAIVESAGTGVLVLRPAIINLDIVAPDVMQAGRSRTFTTSAGSMTLYLEVFDGVTGELLARVIDPEKARDYGRMSVTNGATNKAEADRIFKKWAEALGNYLERARSSSLDSRDKRGSDNAVSGYGGTRLLG